jgi:hypothetical protein
MASIHGINISPGMNARGPAAPVGPEGNCSRAPTARPSGPRDPLLAADAPTAAPEATPARAKIAATSTPRSAMPSEAASARNGRHVGWRHGRPAQRRKRLGLMRCQRHHQPDAGCRKQNRLPHALSPLTFNCRPARRKARSAAKHNRSLRRRDIGSASDRPASASHRGEPPRQKGVSNFAQTADARSGNF